ncbi:MAG: lysophospholipid acyltransferase family protein [Chitinispirillaceae bacterium]
MKKWIPKRLRDDILSAAASAAYALGRSIPRPLGLWFFGLVGRLAYVFSRKERRRTLNHLRSVYGEFWDEKKIRTTALRVFSMLGKNMFDALCLSRMSAGQFDRTVTHDSLDEVRAAYDKGRGLFAITGHIGCFEMLLHFFARKGIRSFAIGRKFDDPRIDRVVRKMRSGPGIEYMDRSESSRKIVRLLKEGRAFGVLVDQDTKVEGVFAEFLGRTAYTPSGPVRLAMKLDIPVFVLTTVRRENGTHHVFISKEVEMNNSGDFDKDLVSNVQKVNDLLCERIQKFPEQWVWMHRRWRTRPKQEENVR